MRRWFLSYHSQDIARAEALEAALRRKDGGAHIFFAPKTLRAGGYWMPQLADAIAQTTVFVLLVGEKGIGPWQVDEYCEARDRRVNTVLVLLDGQPAPGLPFLRHVHWIVTADPCSEQSLARLMDAAQGAGTRPGELWRHTAPYRGLAAMTEADSDFFFGRARKIVEVIEALETVPDRLPVLLGNSGVGKSSLAQAGVTAALVRQGWPDGVKDAGPWPPAFRNSRRWCFLKLRPGIEPLKALVESFLRTWQFDATDPLWARRQAEWVGTLMDERFTIIDLMDATERRCEELRQPKPPAFFLYIDQGEELYVRAEERQHRRFSQAVTRGLRDPRLRALMSLRSDFLGYLQTEEELFDVHHQINVPPLRRAELHEVVTRPAELLFARFETGHLASDIAERAAADSAKETGALPLLSYLLDDMWSKMVERGDGTLRLSSGAVELGRVLVERADAFLAEHPDAESQLRRVLTLKLATVREDGEPTRRRALRSEFQEDEWRLVSALADYPNRLLVTATPDEGDTYAEVAHEAIFGRWDKLREWIAAEREFLAWRSGIEAARRAWRATPAGAQHDALLMGAALTQAQNWLARRAEDLPKIDQEFIFESVRRERKARFRRRATNAGAVALPVLLGAAGWGASLVYWNFIVPLRAERTQYRPYVHTAAMLAGAPPGAAFQDCREGAADCPVMVVLPEGRFLMGWPAAEPGSGGPYDPDLRGEGDIDEQPQHWVSIRRFAVARYDVTFDEWQACVNAGGCRSRPHPDDGEFGGLDAGSWCPSHGVIPKDDAGSWKGRHPVINTTWTDAQEYAGWLSRMTGQHYRLLTEAEWEYAARGDNGRSTAYFWGNSPRPPSEPPHAVCRRLCGSDWDNKGTAPAGCFAPNDFGLYDMAGNVIQWVQDCKHDRYEGAPIDGSAWEDQNGGDCSQRMLRGGNWGQLPPILRSAERGYDSPLKTGENTIGFRVARDL
jgi:formylglycine-generating enzyme required for sulfatase activity